MSKADTNFLARWTRRKQAVEAAEAAGEHLAAASEHKIPPTATAQPAEPPPANSVEGEEPENAEPLPRLEDLTAQSDLSAFLRKGIPETLRKAAMRRMWSLDPAIRDYVGPSEYAWDFNKPESIPGFGPMRQATKEMVASVFGIVRAKAEAAAEGIDEVEGAMPASAAEGEMRAGRSPAAAAAARASVPPSGPGASASPREGADDVAQNANPAGSSGGPQDQGSSNARINRHGGATPKR